MILGVLVGMTAETQVATLPDRESRTLLKRLAGLPKDGIRAALGDGEREEAATDSNGDSNSSSHWLTATTGDSA